MRERSIGNGRRSWALGVLVALCLLGGTGAARADRFADWLTGLRADAEAAGIRPQTLDIALSGVAPLPKIIELDHKQPEFTLTFQDYIDRTLPQDRVDRARERLRQRAPLLAPIVAQYGVPGRFLVALWGIESDFGRQTGGFSVVAALATLAFDGRRSAYFRGELLDALRILDRGDVSAAGMKGSWAGAMGQSQFMPSTFLRFAVDYNGDGKRDIWSDGPDLFASIANYLAQSGWQAGEGWGTAVLLPAGFDPSQASLDVQKPVADWEALGVRPAAGGALPPSPLPVSVLLPGGADGPAFLVYENFRVLLKWNRSNYFAAAVGMLADRIE